MTSASPTDEIRKRWIAAIGTIALLVGTASPAGAATGDEEAAAPTWRFKRDDKPVKVVVLAGSIGAFPDQPYAKEIARLCKHVEVKNLSKVGQGAWALKQRFKEQVIANRRVDPDAEGQEHWLVFGGGLNSVGTPKMSNRHVRDLFVLAHAHGFRVVGLTVTPWGDLADRRWRGQKALDYRRVTREVVDFSMGRLSPKDALGAYADRRKGGPEAPWDPIELPDVAVDLYDSPLRDRAAALRDLAAMRTELERDKRWRQATKGLDALARAAKLEADALMLAELPQWFMRAELRSFDHIHPNRDGHRIMAAVMCPQLPASWACTCEPLEPAVGSSSAQ
jgi:hypothetical protein